VYVLANFSSTRHPSLLVKLTWICLLIPVVIFVAWLALKYFDEPVRARLTRHFGMKRLAALSKQQVEGLNQIERY
jgi:peptidoglycan/LPS O-acetylase OafA/YrhL